MRTLLTAVIAALGVAAVAGAVSQQSEARPALPAKVQAPATLGVAYRPNVYGFRGTLAWFDPLTLKVLPGRKAPLGGHVGTWAFSSDRSILAAASCAEANGVTTGIRFVNARAMRVLGDLALAQYQCLESLTWLRPRRLLAVVRTNDNAAVLVVDPVARRVLRRVSVPAYPSATAHTHDDLVLLCGTDGAFAPAQLLVVDPDGRVRTTRVERVLAGTVVDDQSTDYRARTVRPGLAVDPDGGRAFLVPASGAVAEIDLATLAVSYHELDHSSLLHRFLSWLTPAAAAKALEGPEREAAWAGDGKLAVSGVDYSTVRDSKGAPTVLATPAGTALIDTRSWRSQLLSGGASAFALLAGGVIAEGGSWSEAEQRSEGPGLEAFSLDGHKLWQLHRGEQRWIDLAGSVGYVHETQGQAEVVDLATGEIVGTLQRDEQRNPWPTLLAAQSWDQ
jgi:hypothetical protein